MILELRLFVIIIPGNVNRLVDKIEHLFYNNCVSTHTLLKNREVW